MRALPFLISPAARRLGLSFLLGVYLIVGSIASLKTGLIIDDPTEQQTFRKVSVAAKSFIIGHVDEFKQLQSYDQRYYGVGFYAFAYPFQALVRPYVARTFNIDDETALLLARRPVVFLLFVVSIVFFYRCARFFIRERWIAIANTAAYATYPYLFGHAMINIKDSPFMSVYVICTYLSLRLVKRRLRKSAGSVRVDLLGLAFATAALVSIRIPGVMILVQYAFTFGMADHVKLAGGEASVQLLRYQNLLLFSAVLGPLVILVYPALWANPLHEIVAALKWMGLAEQPGCTLTWGQCMKPHATPAYLFGWLVVKLPALILISILFLPFTLKKVVREPFQRVAYLTLLFGSLYVLIAIMAMRARLYDETRHLLFIYPFLFLIGPIAIYFWSRKLALIAASLSVAIFVCDQVQLAPYQYVYFNEFARFLDVDKLFETDYWGTSGREHTQLLANDVRSSKTLACLYADPWILYRPFIDSRVCVESLDLLNEYPPNNGFVVAITCSPNRLTVPLNCRQLSAITRTLRPSTRKITMSVAYYCIQ